MQPLSGERGSVAILAAVSIVVLSGFAAGIVRVGENRAEGVELQNAVDAAALAIAEDCATATCAMPAATALAQGFLATAAGGGATLDGLDLADRRVTVRAAGATGATALAAATWNAPTPVDVCDYANAVSGESSGLFAIRFDTSRNHPNKPCPGPAGLGANEHVWSTFDYERPEVVCGLAERSPCTLDALRSHLGRAMHLPVYTVRHNGKWDHDGARRFVLTGFHVGDGWTSSTGAPPCSGVYRCLTGVFGDQSPLEAAGVRLQQ